jgi:hypothetical protein
MPYPPSNDSEAEELRLRVGREKRLAAAYLAHPDPRDPDWPGHWLDEEEKPAGPDDEEPTPKRFE